MPVAFARDIHSSDAQARVSVDTTRGSSYAWAALAQWRLLHAGLGGRLDCRELAQRCRLLIAREPGLRWPRSVLASAVGSWGGLGDVSDEWRCQHCGARLNPRDRVCFSCQRAVQPTARRADQAPG